MTQNEKVFRVRETDDCFSHWIVADGNNCMDTGHYVCKDGTVVLGGMDTEYTLFTYYNKAEAQAALDLYKQKQDLLRPVEDKIDAMRKFDGGATRATTQGKLDYVKALSPIVLRRYVQYLNEHRLQPDGSYRDFDNWKQGMPQAVYHSSGGRHFFDAWLLTEGYTAEDNHGPVDLEDALCAELFNIMGRLFEILDKKERGIALSRFREDINGTD